MKFNLMQIALRLFELELSKGSTNADYTTIYNNLKTELEGAPKTNIDPRPTAQEYFNNKKQ